MANVHRNAMDLMDERVVDIAMTARLERRSLELAEGQPRRLTKSMSVHKRIGISSRQNAFVDESTLIAPEQKTLLTIEYRIGRATQLQTSQLGEPTPRQLSKYIRHVIDNFTKGESPKPHNGLVAEPLHARDLRKLQQPFNPRNQPGIIVRRHVLLLNFDPIRAIVLHDRLIVIVDYGFDSILDDLGKRLSESEAISLQLASAVDEGDAAQKDDEVYRKHRNNAMSTFPFRAVEAVMATVLADLETNFRELEYGVSEILAELYSGRAAVTVEMLAELRSMKNIVAEVRSKP